MPEKTKNLRIKIVGDGTPQNTHIYDLATGEELINVTKAIVTIDSDEGVVLTELTFITGVSDAQFDIESEVYSA